jgi:hypothetical protein
LLALRANLPINPVTSLEPRTPHQPEKLKKLSKNEYVFTPSIFAVNEKLQVVSTRVFNRVQPVHKPVPKFGADEGFYFFENPLWTRLSAGFIHGHEYSRASKVRGTSVKIAYFAVPASIFATTTISPAAS